MMVGRRGCFGREAYDCFRERKMRAGAVFFREYKRTDGKKPSVLPF